MLKRYRLTYSNNGDRCTLDRSVVKLYACNRDEAKQLCRDLYAVTNAFNIYDTTCIARLPRINNCIALDYHP